MFENVTFTQEQGTKNSREVVVFALSTCGFCARGLAFLRTNNIKFSYVYVDKMDPAAKEQVKKELMDKYKERVVFPYLILDSTKVVTGFVEETWKKEFNIQ